MYNNLFLDKKNILPCFIVLAIYVIISQKIQVVWRQGLYIR